MDGKKQFFVYILECADNSFYTGWTLNLNRRLAEHNKGTASKYTRARLPVKIVYKEHLSTKQEALRREIAIKKLSRSKKQMLVSASLN